MGFLDAVVTVLTSLKSLGVAGRVGYVVSLSFWTFFCLPTTPIELASGFIFPLWAATFMSVAGKTAGSLFALVLGRRFLKPFISRMLSRVGGGGSSSALHRHLVSELKLRPIQTMSILRAAPLPTPFKIYGLCMFEPELVPAPAYFLVALIINTCWSLVWSLTGSSAGSLQDAVSGKGDTSTAALVTKLFTVVALFGCFTAFARFAKAKMQPPPEDAPASASATEDASAATAATTAAAKAPRARATTASVSSSSSGVSSSSSSSPSVGGRKARSKSPAARAAGGRSKLHAQ